MIRSARELVTVQSELWQEGIKTLNVIKKKRRQSKVIKVVLPK